MSVLTPEETLRHIHYKAACGEVGQGVAERMLELFQKNPALDYAALLTAAMKREIPEIAFHTSALQNRASITTRGLIAADPAKGQYGLLAMGQPIGVYASVEPDENGVWAGAAVVWDIWSITGAASLPHRQDPLNPEQFVILCDVPGDMVSLRGSASFTTGPHPLDRKNAG